MAIYRCNKCGHLEELQDLFIGTQANCAACATPSQVYATTKFVQHLLAKYFAAHKENTALKQSLSEQDEDNDTGSDHIEMSTSGELATSAQHAPIANWLAQFKVKPEFDLSAVDTSGFFDEAAEILGNNYGLMREVLDRIKFNQRKGYDSAFFELAERSQKEGQLFNELCRKLYGYSFFSRYNYNKQEKKVRLHLQSAPAIKSFFSGEWLEWYALIQSINLLNEKKQRFSIARGMKIHLPNEDLHELDVFMLVNGNQPICIECKTGEYRDNIDKYLRLKKRLGLSASRFILCVNGLSAEEEIGLSSMYDLTFVSEQSLTTHLAKIL